MPAKLVSDDGAHVVIRPLVYVGEDEARAYAKECELPIIGCCCPACGDLSLQRQRDQAAADGARARASRREAVDAEGARQRRAAAPARHAAELRRRDRPQRTARLEAGRATSQTNVRGPDVECPPLGRLATLDAVARESRRPAGLVRPRHGRRPVDGRDRRTACSSSSASNAATARPTCTTSPARSATCAIFEDAADTAR